MALKDKTVMGIVSIPCITMMTLYAMSLGYNGYLLTSSVGAICLIVGWAYGKKEK